MDSSSGAGVAPCTPRHARDDARMVELSKGANIRLVDTDVAVVVDFAVDMAGVDLFSVLLRGDGTAGSDRNLVFFNQPASTCGGVTMTQGLTVQLRLGAVPADVETIIVAAALDDAVPGTFASRGGGVVTVRSARRVLASHTITGLDKERCVVLVEVYRRDGGWKVRAVSQGWVNGVADLIESYGIVVDEHGPEQHAPESVVIIVPDEFAEEPIGAGAEAWQKKRAGLPLNPYEELDASEYEQGLVRGADFLKWGDEVARLKREGHLREALGILLEILDATEQVQAQERANAPERAALLRWRVENVVVRETPPGWTENAAIVLRKLGDIEGEIAIIDRWLAHAGDPANWVGATHAKLLARRAKALALLETKRSP